MTHKAEEDFGMSNGLTLETAMKALDWCYDKSQKGLPKMRSASELAESYLLKHNQDSELAIKDFVKWQHAKVGTTGFLTGLGGIVTIPLTLPIDITSVLYVQMRMIAVIAYIRNYDLHDDQVKTFVFVCLAGQSGVNMLAEAGVQIGQKAAINLIKKIPTHILKAINKKVGMRVVTKFGQKGLINLGKLVPVVGGVIGGTANVSSNMVIARTAKKVFVKQNGSVVNF